MINKIIVFLIIIVIGLGAVGYWFYQENIYSKDILRLEIFGPETAIVGEEVEFNVRFKNNGDVRLEEPRLIFEYPNSAEPINGEALRVTKESDEMEGAIYPGQEKIFRFKARLFGKQGEIKEAKAMVSYRPNNLKARYVSKTSSLTTLGEVPLTFEFDIPSTVSSGPDLNFSLNYFSSIDYPLSDLEIRISYPSSFELKETDPEGLSGHEWKLSHLNKAEGGRIDIKGDIKGETGAAEIFKAELGLWQSGEFVVLKESTKQVKIVEPSLYVSQVINNSLDYTADSDDLLHYEITFRNIGNSPLQNLFLVSKLYSPLFDLESIRSPFGRSETGDNSIIWDWHDLAKLQFLDAGEAETVEFWINLKKDVLDVDKAKLENEIILGQMRRRFINKVNASYEFHQNAYVDDEIFGSQEKLPPEVGEESLFTIIWKLKSYYNPIENVKVRSTLPSGVRLTGEIMPQKLAFDPVSREIVWSIGDLEPNQGVDVPLQLAFQIGFKPSSKQRDKFAQLISTVIVKGFDEWTEQEISATSSPITTQVFGEQGKVK